jgi:hypothetical protein
VSRRYYVAEGVRLYSQETWELVMGTEGVWCNAVAGRRAAGGNGDGQAFSLGGALQGGM